MTASILNQYTAWAPILFPTRRKTGSAPGSRPAAHLTKKRSSRKNSYYCGNSFAFWTNGTVNKRSEGGGLHNVMEISDFARKPFPCPVCNMTLRLKISCKQKPYCMCLECGIQIFFRGQAGIHRLHEMIRSEEAVAAEFNGPARAIFLYNHLQSLKRQRQSLEDKQGIIFRDSDRDKAIQSLDIEINRVRSELEQEVENDREKQNREKQK